MIEAFVTNSEAQVGTHFVQRACLFITEHTPPVWYINQPYQNVGCQFLVWEILQPHQGPADSSPFHMLPWKQITSCFWICGRKKSTVQPLFSLPILLAVVYTICYVVIASRGILVWDKGNATLEGTENVVFNLAIFSCIYSLLCSKALCCCFRLLLEWNRSSKRSWFLLELRFLSTRLLKFTGRLQGALEDAHMFFSVWEWPLRPHIHLLYSALVSILPDLHTSVATQWIFDECSYIHFFCLRFQVNEVYNISECGRFLVFCEQFHYLSNAL